MEVIDQGSGRQNRPAADEQHQIDSLVRRDRCSESHDKIVENAGLPFMPDPAR
jgi:hypothetical protein